MCFRRESQDFLTSWSPLRTRVPAAFCPLSTFAASMSRAFSCSLISSNRSVTVAMNENQFRSDYKCKVGQVFERRERGKDLLPAPVLPIPEASYRSSNFYSSISSGRYYIEGKINLDLSASIVGNGTHNLVLSWVWCWVWWWQGAISDKPVIVDRLVSSTLNR